MIKAVEMLRETADEFERRGKTTPNLAIRAELVDIAVKWHFLAGEIERLSERAEKLKRL